MTAGNSAAILFYTTKIMKISDFTTRRADRIELTGDVTLADVVELSQIHVNTLDISQARFGIEEEYWEQVLG